MYRIPLIALCLLLLACEDDDDSRNVCLPPEDLTNCQDLRELSPQAYFNTITGDYVVTNSIGFFANGEQQTCFAGEGTVASLSLRADSTYRSVSADELITGRWSVVTVPLGPGVSFTRIEGDGGFFFDPPEFACAGDFYYVDERPTDGLYYLYQRR